MSMTRGHTNDMLRVHVIRWLPTSGLAVMTLACRTSIARLEKTFRDVLHVVLSASIGSFHYLRLCTPRFA